MNVPRLHTDRTHEERQTAHCLQLFDLGARCSLCTLGRYSQERNNLGALQTVYELDDLCGVVDGLTMSAELSLLHVADKTQHVLAPGRHEFYVDARGVKACFGEVVEYSAICRLRPQVFTGNAVHRAALTDSGDGILRDLTSA